MKIIGPLLIC